MKAVFGQVQDVEYPDLKVQEINANHQNLLYETVHQQSTAMMKIFHNIYQQNFVNKHF